jgi:cellulose synthase/poly-beta-1,6-N-acetylglucosamine synthase-like glycosyltransferase
VTILFLVIALFFTCLSLYLAALTAGAFFFRKKTDRRAPPLKLTVLIPAHNEALQIGATVRAVAGSRYPRERCRIIVIADNCDDETAAVAEEAGALALVRSDPVRRGKGQALDWFLREKQDLYSSCDGIVIIDADTVIDADFLGEVSASLAHEEVQVVQGYYGVLNATENWRTALMSAALAVFHHVRPAGRNRFGGSAGLKGNGMGFRSSVLRKYGWPAYSIVEDLEFGARMLLDGICVHYNPDAVIRAEMAVTRKQAETQRSRWEGGRYEIFRKYAPAFLRMWAASRKFCYFDGFMDLLIPPLSALVLVVVLLLALSLWLFPPAVAPMVLSIASIGLYVVSGLVLRKAPLTVWLYLMAAPFFILWKVPLYLKIIKGGSGGEWVRTKRKAEMGEK